MVFPTTACFGPQNNLRLFTCLSTTHTEAIYLLGVGQDNADGSFGRPRLKGGKNESSACQRKETTRLMASLLTSIAEDDDPKGERE
jgi:hypothetical protein